MAVFPVASSGIMLFSPLLFFAIWLKTAQAGTFFIAPEEKPDKTRTPSCSGVVWREDFVDMACEFNNHFFEFTLSDTTPDINAPSTDLEDVSDLEVFKTGNSRDDVSEGTQKHSEQEGGKRAAKSQDFT